MRSHAVTFQSFCGYLLSGHREWGLSPEAASAGQDDEGRQSVSSLAALTLSIPETASSSQISGQTPYLHYQSSTNGEKGTPLPLDQARGRTSSQHASRLWSQEAGGAWFCTQVWRHSQVSLCRCPGSSNTANRELERRPGAGCVHLRSRREVCKKGGPEVRIWGGRLPMGLKRKPLRSQLCSGVPGECLDSSTSSSGWACYGE